MKFFVVLLIFISLASSSTNYPPWLNQQAEASPKSARYLFSLVRQGDVEAEARLLQLAEQPLSDYWLSLLAGEGSVDARFVQAMYAESARTKKQLLLQNAHMNHAESQFELSLMSDNASSRLLWLQKAAQANFLPAIISLYQWYLLHDNLDEAIYWMSKAAEYDAASGVQYARILWQQNNVSRAKDVFKLSADLGSDESSFYLRLIDKYHGKPASQVTAQNKTVSRENCVIQLQPLSTSLETTRKAIEFIDEFKKDNRLRDLPLCINDLVWQQDLNCSSRYNGQPRLGCDVGKIAKLAERTDFTHVMVFAPEGKANVNNGIMYLDLADTYSVFVHELAHFAGFVDEYPLGTEMASRICNRQAPNLMMEQPDGQSLGFIPGRTRTCHNIQLSRYKPANVITFMEYHDVGVIPEYYLQQWKTIFTDSQQLTPAFVNFRQHYIAIGENEKAEYWWQRFQSFRFQSPF